jgi:hypothetical protein
VCLDLDLNLGAVPFVGKSANGAYVGKVQTHPLPKDAFKNDYKNRIRISKCQQFFHLHFFQQTAQHFKPRLIRLNHILSFLKNLFGDSA